MNPNELIDQELINQFVHSMATGDAIATSDLESELLRRLASKNKSSVKMITLKASERLGDQVIANAKNPNQIIQKAKENIVNGIAEQLGKILIISERHIKEQHLMEYNAMILIAVTVKK